MDLKKVMLLVGALMVAAVTAVMARNMFAGAGAKQAIAAPAVPTGPKVLVAATDLPVGTILEPTSLKFVAWPKDGMQDSYYAQTAPDSDPSKLVGMVVRYPVTAGQPLTRGSLVGPQDRGFLAAALTPGMRAVTVPVNATSGLAGFVFPGDHVDIVLTESVNGSGDGEALKVSETILRNVRVLATDQRYQDKDADGKVKVQQASNVTLEVTPKIAEKIAVAQSVGTLSLSLRSLADSSETDRAIASGDIKIPAGTTPDAEKQMLAAFANRPMDTDTTYTTGGDVSRFQPRTVQAKAPAAPAAGSGPVSSGPVVRIARGNDVSVVPVGVR